MVSLKRKLFLVLCLCFCSIHYAPENRTLYNRCVKLQKYVERDTMTLLCLAFGGSVTMSYLLATPSHPQGPVNTQGYAQIVICQKSIDKTIKKTQEGHMRDILKRYGLKEEDLIIKSNIEKFARACSTNPNLNWAQKSFGPGYIRKVRNMKQFFKLGNYLFKAGEEVTEKEYEDKVIGVYIIVKDGKDIIDNGDAVKLFLTDPNIDVKNKPKA